MSITDNPVKPEKQFPGVKPSVSGSPWVVALRVEFGWKSKKAELMGGVKITRKV